MAKTKPVATSAANTNAATTDAGTPVLPWVRYDHFSAEEVLAVCARGGKAVKRRVLAYERVHQKRAAILDALEAALLGV